MIEPYENILDIVEKMIGAPEDKQRMLLGEVRARWGAQVRLPEETVKALIMAIMEQECEHCKDIRDEAYKIGHNLFRRSNDHETSS